MILPSTIRKLQVGGKLVYRFEAPKYSLRLQHGDFNCPGYVEFFATRAQRDKRVAEWQETQRLANAGAGVLVGHIPCCITSEVPAANLDFFGNEVPAAQR